MIATQLFSNTEKHSILMSVRDGSFLILEGCEGVRKRNYFLKTGDPLGRGKM